MKKYISGILAAVIVIGASAFISTRQHAPEAVFYWYKVDASGTTMPAGSQVFGGAQTISYANANLPCTHGDKAECIRGFNSPIALPSTATGDTDPLLRQ